MKSSWTCYIATKDAGANPKPGHTYNNISHDGAVNNSLRQLPASAGNRGKSGSIQHGTVSRKRPMPRRSYILFFIMSYSIVHRCVSTHNYDSWSTSLSPLFPVKISSTFVYHQTSHYIVSQWKRESKISSQSRDSAQPLDSRQDLKKNN